MSKFLDSTGVSYLWQKIKSAFSVVGHTHDRSDIEDLIGQGIPFVMGTQTATTASWTGVADFLATPADLVSGISILYYIPRTSASNATLNLTCANGGTTGAKNVYYSGTTRVGTHYAAGNVVRLTYLTGVAINGSGSYTGWWAEANYDSNSTNTLRYQAAIKAQSAIVAGNIIVADADGDYFHLKTGAAFDIRYPILYAGSAISAGSTGTNNFVHYPFAIATTQAASTAATSWGAALVAYKPVYIRGTLNGTTFTPISTTPLTQNIVYDANNPFMLYWEIGVMYSTANIYLLEQKHFWWVNPYDQTTVLRVEDFNALQMLLNNVIDMGDQLGTLANSIPTKTSELINDSDFITSQRLPTAVSDLTNDTGFITASDIPVIPENTSDLNNDSGYITNYDLPTNLSDFTDDLGSSPTHTHSQYLTSHQTIKVDGITGNSISRYAICSTASDTAAKTASVTSGAFSLSSGARVTVLFHYVNGVADCTLNVNGSGAKTIKYWDSAALAFANITLDTAKVLRGVVDFVCDGTYWIVIGGSILNAPLVDRYAIQAVKIDGVLTEIGSSNNYATCSTSAATAAKTVSLTSYGLTLTAGLRIMVKFANANTASNPTLNVDNLGAKNIFIDNARITTGNNKSVLRGVVEFIYDGTQWHVVGTGKVGTTLSDYGITDAKIQSGTITLGSNTITPLTAHQTLKTINGQSIVGSGNITIQSGGSASMVPATLHFQSILEDHTSDRAIFIVVPSDFDLWAHHIVFGRYIRMTARYYASHQTRNRYRKKGWIVPYESYISSKVFNGGMYDYTKRRPLIEGQIQDEIPYTDYNGFCNVNGVSYSAYRITLEVKNNGNEELIYDTYFTNMSLVGYVGKNNSVVSVTDIMTKGICGLAIFDDDNQQISEWMPFTLTKKGSTTYVISAPIAKRGLSITEQDIDDVIDTLE